MNAKTIRERFEHETGDRLTIHRVRVRGLPDFDTLDAGKLAERHGRFSIGVFPDAARARRERLLREPSEPDEQGVGWEHVEEDDRADPPGWIATKVYGHVQLQWFTEERTLDERWQLLDRVLGELEGGRSH
jgi:hypothetical protein